MTEKRYVAPQPTTVEQMEQDSAARTKLRERHKDMFPIGTKYMFALKMWYVVDARTEQGTEFRRVMNSFGQEEIVTVDTLLKDQLEGGDTFIIMEPTETEKLMMKGISQGLGQP